MHPSHILLFNTFSYVQTGYYEPSYDLHLADVDTGKLKTIASKGNGGDIYPSPDGKTIALVSPESIILMDAKGNNRQTVITYPYTHVSGESELVFASKLIWSEDSRSFVIAIPQLNFPELPPTADTKIWRISIDPPSSELVAQIDLQPFHRGPVISPDLDHIIYEPADTEDKESDEIHLSRIDGSEEIIIYKKDPFLPYIISWLPDSKHFVFVFENQVLIGDTEGNNVRLIQRNLGRIRMFRCLDSTNFLAVYKQNELRLGVIEEPASVLITPLGSIYEVYDFVH
jgi:Tol biopolymer transport system component